MPESAVEKDGVLPAVDSAERSDPGLTFLQFIRTMVRPIASLRLTVVLFVLSLALVFFGTVAQKNRETFLVVDQYFYSWHVWIPFQLLAEVGKVFLYLPENTTLSGSFPFPGGFLLGWALFANLLAAHFVRFRFTWKRAGILITHTGVALLLFGEFLHYYGVEATMSIPEGGRVNYVDVTRKVELAFLAPTGPDVEDAVVIPQAMLQRPGAIRDDRLPVDVEMFEYHINSFFEDTSASDPHAVRFADPSGHEGYVKFVPVPEESGTSGARPNAPMVRFLLRKKGTSEVLGTYNLSLWAYPSFSRGGLQFAPQTVKVGETTYTIEFRLKRVYKPYSVMLKKFEVEYHPGTDNPKSYSSEVKLEDKELEEERDVRIWMNHPLRHRGETLYQHSFFPGNTGTVLQVVENPGAILPYISCSMISGGMLIHFGILLTGFLRRRTAA